MPENRKHPRKSIDSSVGWSLPSAARVDVRCRDISLGGCFLEVVGASGNVMPAFGDAVVVYLDLPGLVDETGRQVETVVPSTVRWTTSAGMGVQFGPMGARETAALLQLIGK